MMQGSQDLKTGKSDRREQIGLSSREGGGEHKI